jgi:predicted CxxxxCH...CXXCH cytochrome family protein
LTGFQTWSPTITPTPTPQPVNGQTVYDNNCSGCHAVNGYDASGNPDLAAAGSLIPNKLASGHNGVSLTGEEITAVAGFVDQYQAQAGGPDYSDCTACHAQPPNGNSSPNTAGAHATHQALPGVGTDCSICHLTADHNGNVDLAFPANYDEGGVATDNLNGTCSNISCHGGQTTPDWWSGSINVNTQCSSCHTRPNTGQHQRRQHVNLDCAVCHNTAKMGNHFGDLATLEFETDPATTIAGGSTSVGSYSGSTCSSIACHGSKNW